LITFSCELVDLAAETGRFTRRPDQSTGIHHQPVDSHRRVIFRLGRRRRSSAVTTRGIHWESFSRPQVVDDLSQHSRAFKQDPA
jgi:hypothetical protein